METQVTDWKAKCKHVKELCEKWKTREYFRFDSGPEWTDVITNSSLSAVIKRKWRLISNFFTTEELDFYELEQKQSDVAGFIKNLLITQ